MAKLKLIDADTAAVYGLPQADTDTEAILKDYAARGWKDADTMRQIDAAIQAGAYIKEAIKYTARNERIMKAGDAQGVKDNG